MPPLLTTYIDTYNQLLLFGVCKASKQQMSLDQHASATLRTLMAPVQIVSIYVLCAYTCDLMHPFQLIWMLGGESLANKYLRPNYQTTKGNNIVPLELTWAQSPDSILLVLLVACQRRHKAPEGSVTSLPPNSTTISQVYSEAADQHQRTLNMVSFQAFILLIKY